MITPRDRWDSEHGGLSLLKHLAFETTFSQTAIGVSLVFGVAHLARGA